MLVLAILLLFVALLLLWGSSRMLRSSGLPEGRLIYADVRQWQPVVEPLFDPHYALTGKPDYLVQQGKYLIPVEVKSKGVKALPLEAHIMQLAAYCLLVHQCYGNRPPYGILHYPNRTFAVKYTPRMEAQVLQLIEAIKDSKAKEIALNRSHNSSSRCFHCGYRDICDQKLM